MGRDVDVFGLGKDRGEVVVSDVEEVLMGFDLVVELFHGGEFTEVKEGFGWEGVEWVFESVETMMEGVGGEGIGNSYFTEFLLFCEVRDQLLGHSRAGTDNQEAHW